MRVELQLESVRKDLVQAASAAESAEEARVQAEEKEASTRRELEEALGCLEEVTTKIAVLESEKDELQEELSSRKVTEQDEQELEEQKSRLAKLEKEDQTLKQEKDMALDAVVEAKQSHAEALADREQQIESLNNDVEVHREQMELAQAMLEERENAAFELKKKLDEVRSEEKMKVAQLEEDLAAKSREVTVAKAELQERSDDITRLEERLEKLRGELFEQTEAAAKASMALDAAVTPKAEDEDGDDTPSASEDEKIETSAAIPSPSKNASNLAELAQKEMFIEKLERELKTSKRNLEATQVELEQKDKTAERLRAELERMKTEKGMRMEELEKSIEEKNSNLEKLRKELEEKKQLLTDAESRLKGMKLDLDTALEAAKDAEEARENACKAAEQSKSAEQSTKHMCEKLKTQIDLLQKAKENIESELETVKTEKEKEKQSSTQAAATLAATNAARQAEMEMTIEKMTKDIDAKKREIDAIKSQLQEKDKNADRLMAELRDAREDMVSYKEKIEAEKEREVWEKATTSIADKDYFDENELDNASTTSDYTSHTASANSRRGAGLFGMFAKKQEVEEYDENTDWEAKLREKDARIAELEKSLAANALSVSNLKNELVAASNKFKQDETQRRLLIQRLESENSAYSLKIEALEHEFNEIKATKEKLNLAHARGIPFVPEDSCNSGMDLSTTSSSMGSEVTGTSNITGASMLSPIERENKKLKKAKKIYENRVASLQTQLAEIQQIVPELMAKSKSQITKLEASIKTQKEEAEAKEKALQEGECVFLLCYDSTLVFSTSIFHFLPQ